MPTSFEKLLDTLTEAMEAHMIEKLSRSFPVVGPEERKARLHAVMALSVELDAIRKVSIFATGLAESVLEDIIEGDWKAAERFGSHFAFRDESPELTAKYAPLWARFREILEVECLATRARHESGGMPS